MEASKFWRLRNAWHGFKARLRLSNGAIGPYVPPAASPGERNGHAYPPAPPESSYDAWLARNAPRPADVERMRSAVRLFARRPLISIVMATYDTPEPYLRAALASVSAQAYPQWELCVADDASRDEGVRAALRAYAAGEPRARVIFRETNGHIARAFNSALELATGEFVLFLDHDDVLPPDALYELAGALVADPSLDVVYSDEDKIDDAGRRSDPHFKPDWCPDSFLSRMYVGHFLACRRTLVAEAGGFRAGFEGSQDYDLLLRLSERTERIHHIPKVLYHWRTHAGSTAHDLAAKPYASQAAERALNEALVRRGERGTVAALPDCPNTYAVRFSIVEHRRVSVILPTRDHGDDVRRALDSLRATTSYPDLEIVLLDNGSRDRASLATFAELAAEDSRIRVLRHDVPFNFSAINNYAVTQTDGTYLLFLNNDTEAVSQQWIEAMVEQAQRPAIGAVGALLLYPDRSVQHAGVIMGLGGVAGHSHRHVPGNAPGYYGMLRAVNNYSAVTGACMMVRRGAFEEAGGFDEALAVAFNDVDFCLRLRRAGYRNVYLPHVVLLHFESKSRGAETTPEQRERFAREIELMLERWPELTERDPCYSPHLTLEHPDYSIRV